MSPAVLALLALAAFYVYSSSSTAPAATTGGSGRAPGTPPAPAASVPPGATSSRDLFPAMAPLGTLMPGGPAIRTPVPPLPPVSAPFNVYLSGLQSAWDQVHSVLRDAWDLDTLRDVARAAATAYGIPPGLLWGLLWRESRWRPVGLYQNSYDAALAAHSSAWGLAQMTRTRWDAERKAVLEGTAGTGSPPSPFTTFGHAAALFPPVAIWQAAASLGRLRARLGGATPTPDEVAAWWSGRAPDRANAGEGAFIVKYGGDVYTGSPPPVDGTAAAPWWQGDTALEDPSWRALAAPTFGLARSGAPMASEPFRVRTLG